MRLANTASKGNAITRARLAAAYGSAGQFERAVATAESALALAGDGASADAIRRHLEGYRKGVPFTE